MIAKTFVCPQCNKVIGSIKVVNNVELLQIDGVLCRELRGFCKHCAGEIRFSTSDSVFRALMEQTMRVDK
jgi:hypothetical protein